MTEKVITTTIEQKHTVFVSFDGIEFDCNEECAKYENSAMGVILKKLCDKAINVDADSDVFDDNNEGCHYICVKVDTEAIDLITQAALIAGYKKERITINQGEVGKLYMVGYGVDVCRNDIDVTWFAYTSLNAHIDILTKGAYSLIENASLQSSIYSKVQVIKQQERKELRAAMRKYLGDDTKNPLSYSFKETKPYIAAYVGDSPADVEVISVTLDDGYLSLTVKDKESGEILKNYDLDEVFAGHLDVVTSTLIAEFKTNENPTEV